MVEQIDADAFGNLDQSSGLRQAHLYAGEYWDQDAQLLYLRARWYDPRIGRFISADPFEGKQTDPSSLNRYVYAHSDPVHRLDPSGEFSAMEIGAAQAIGGLTTSIGAVGILRAGQSITENLSLQMAASSRGIYIAIDPRVKTDLETCIEASRNGERRCRPDFAMFVLGDDTSSVRDHIGDAMGSTSPSMLSRGPDQGRDWIERHKGPGRPCSGGSSMDCDEYPFNASRQGGEGNYPAKVSLRSVTAGENRRAGAHLRWFHQRCNIPENGGNEYKVMAVKGIPRTGYICGR